MKRKSAAAIKYEKGLSAPVVTALGFGHVAEKIINAAIDSDVPIIENEDLVSSLSSVSVGDNIPKELYEIVAEIIAYVYSLDKK
ncbi:EscU/YscU/HrcU family type III secretion system export apparatus switch protein [Clostridium cylindrosporum]|uniref:Flagellar biosynthesis protein FlhB n=1 Tax=Clostridium cylindrosporum DSM 605 TaxID=1121307 RepID=A0A0J8D936_CLOCY|nr:EscU/YscU/HrcU family type III secretion system export apparatus switch protein [Clostridium cylindrosporum]KMT20859.1 flagellar biosynthesis protein FlhB [Clostridium cylindrosporum DSM 605]